jgi:Concanavalin A-like lectin/glucanases superfamily
VNQAQWNARVAARGDVWQYFKMDEASGLPLDSGDYIEPGSGGPCDMTSGTGAAYGVTGPFTGAEAITVATMFNSPVYASPAFGGMPMGSVNYGHPKTMEGWVYVNNDPSALGVLIGLGNISILMTTGRQLQLVRQGTGDFSPVGSTVIPTGEWHFIMATTFGGGLRLYLDEAVELDWASVAWPIPNGSAMQLGQSGPSGTFTFSNCAIYNDGSLTPDLGGGAQQPQVYRSGLVF